VLDLPYNFGDCRSVASSTSITGSVTKFFLVFRVEIILWIEIQQVYRVIQVIFVGWMGWFLNQETFNSSETNTKSRWWSHDLRILWPWKLVFRKWKRDMVSVSQAWSHSVGLNLCQSVTPLPEYVLVSFFERRGFYRFGFAKVNTAPFKVDINLKIVPSTRILINCIVITDNIPSSCLQILTKVSGNELLCPLKLVVRQEEAIVHPLC